ncbi:glycoside hydrolase family 78 protein, partial [Aureobasidium melanogenum]
MTHTDRLLQGGVRWQMLTLASAGDLVLSDVGMVPSYYTTKSQGSFECSNTNWTNVWETGTYKIYGSFGIGAANSQSAIFTNLTVTSAGTEIYASSLTSRSTLDDFLVGTNPLSAIVNGARRDRIAYAGDLDVAARTVATSSHALEYVNDTLRLLSSNQMTAGYFVPTVKIQQSPRQGLIDINQTGLIGYSFQLLSAMGEYYMVSGDVAAAKAYAPAAVRMLDWAASQVLENGPFNLTDASFGGDWNNYDPSQSGIVTKFNAVYALALQEVMAMLVAADVETSVYEKTLKTLRESIEKQLYDSVLGGYFVSEAQQHGIAQDANAMAILANVPQGNHTKLQISRSMARLLFVDHGALPFSNGTTDFSKLISPYASSYHLRAAFAAQDAESAIYLLDHTWVPMTLQSNVNYSGCFWETLNLDGKPGLGDATSLCHAWSSGPTAELTRNILGIQAVAPAYQEWRVVPQSLSLKWARGTQPTLYGSITVDWRYDEAGLLAMDVSSPSGTNGTVSLPFPLKSNATGTVVTLVNGQLVSGSSFEVTDGEPFELLQYLV